jgi:hypothetical protein
MTNDMTLQTFGNASRGEERGEWRAREGALTHLELMAAERPDPATATSAQVLPAGLPVAG